MPVFNVEMCESILKIIKFLLDIAILGFWSRLFLNAFDWSFLGIMSVGGILTKNYSLEAGICRIKEWSNFLKLALIGIVFLSLKKTAWPLQIIFLSLFFLERLAFLRLEAWYRKKWRCYRIVKINGNESLKEEIKRKLKKFPEFYIVLREHNSAHCPFYEISVKNLASFINSGVLGTAPLFHFDGIKRMFDLCVSLILLIISLPFFIFVSILIKLDSPGPVFFVHTRIGKDGKPFKLYKFRSMYVNTPKYDYHPNKLDDPRITRVGRWLRKTGLDELPQLINVLKGEMSLVGPRPEMPFIVETYNEIAKQRLKAVPGITGLWQISRDRGELIHKNLEYDLYYIRHRSFFVDLVILFKTALIVIRGKGKEK